MYSRVVLLSICLLVGCQATGRQSAVGPIETMPSESDASVSVSDEGEAKDGDSNDLSDSIQQVAFTQAAFGEQVELIAAEETETEAVEMAADPLAVIEQQAIAINPAIQKAQAELAALQGRRVQVGLHPNPKAGIYGDDINDAGNAGRYGVFYSQQVVRSNRLTLAQREVCAEIKAKEFHIAELTQRLKTDLRLSFSAVVVAGQKIELAEELVGLSASAVEATIQLIEAQELAATAKLQVEIELQRAQLNLKRAKNEMSAARRSLAGFVDEHDLPLDAAGYSLSPEELVVDLESKFQKLLNQSPELDKLFAGVNAARRKLDHQRSLQIPDVNWQAGLAFDFASDEWVPNFQVGVPIQKYNRNQGAIAEARSQIVASERAVEQKTLALRQQLIASYQTYQDARLQVDTIGEEILPTARKTLELVTLGYREGEVGFLELLTAQRTFFSINRDYIQQLGVLWRQFILIDGLMLNDSLEQFE